MLNKFINDQQTKFANGGINRRQFMMSVVAAGVAVPTALSMAETVLASTPKKGGRIRQGFSAGSSNNTLDPMNNEGSMGMLNVNYAWGNNLTEGSS